MPSPWEFVVLALVAFRVTRLIGWDDLTIAWRSWYSGLDDAEYRTWSPVLAKIEETGRDPWEETFTGTAGTITGPPFGRGRWYWSKMLRCPWCLGFWVSLILALSWWAVEGGMIGRVPLTALALSAVVGLAAKNLDP
jgi:hypothetical protein